MKKRMLRLGKFGRTIALFASMTCIAFPSMAMAGDWTGVRKITQLVVDDSSTTVIIPDIDNPASCGVPTFLRVGKAASNYDSITAAILSAQAQGKNVRLFAAVCNGDNSVRITGIWIQP